MEPRQAEVTPVDPFITTYNQEPVSALVKHVTRDNLLSFVDKQQVRCLLCYTTAAPSQKAREQEEVPLC